MDNKISNEVTVIYIDKMIYIHETRHSLPKRPDEKRILSFMKELLDGNEIEESIFWERLRILEIEEQNIDKPSKTWNSFYLPKGSPYASVNTSDISYSQFPCNTPSCPQDLGHDQKGACQKIEALDKIIDQNIKCINPDPPKESISIETQTSGLSSAEYVDSGVGANDDLFVTVENQGTETDSIMEL